MGRNELGTELYLDVLKKILTNVIYEDNPITHVFAPDPDYNAENRLTGNDWPTVAHTMVGLKRLDNVQKCLEQAIADGVEGDFIETGVWRGGTCIFARAVLKAHGVTDRNVWVADSFEGIPETTESSHEYDKMMRLHIANDVLGVPLEVVKQNFEKYDLLDEQVRFLPGWFKDTLPQAPIEKLAILRLDGDLYESTMDALTNLYPKLSVGGYVIIDDYDVISSCKEAVHEYRDKHGVDDEILAIDGMAVYWQRTK